MRCEQTEVVENHPNFNASILTNSAPLLCIHPVGCKNKNPGLIPRILIQLQLYLQPLF